MRTESLTIRKLGRLAGYSVAKGEDSEGREVIYALSRADYIMLAPFLSSGYDEVGLEGETWRITHRDGKPWRAPEVEWPE